MDPRRHLTRPARNAHRSGRLALLAGLMATVTGCAHASTVNGGGAVEIIVAPPAVVLAPLSDRPLVVATVPLPAPAPTDRPDRAEPPGPRPSSPDTTRRAAAARAALATANRAARAGSEADAMVGGVQVFAWEGGRVYEVWTAPLRVTVLTLGPGETVLSKAAGDTVRWQIGESTSGVGAQARAHVLIKPLQTGLETNLVLTTSQRVYLVALRSGGAEAFHPAVAWDADALRLTEVPGSQPVPALDLAPVTPTGPIDARYRIEPQGRPPLWTPTAVFNDGIRTFIALASEVAVSEAPALFVLSGGEAQLVNYRQDGNLIVVDRLFDRAELRLGDRRPRIVTLRRLGGTRP